MFAVLSFIGFEAAAVFRDEARDPVRTVPRATYTALIVVGVFYAVSSWALISGVGGSKAVAYANKYPATMLSDVTDRYLGSVGAHVVSILFVTSVFICMLSFHNISSRYIHTLAAHRALPRRLGLTNHKHGSPAAASLACGLVCAILVALAAISGITPVDQFFTWLGGITSVGVLILMALTCLATIVYFRRYNGKKPIWNTLIAPSLGFLALIGSLVLVFANLPSLVGGSVPIAVEAVALLVVAFITGVIVAKIRRAAGVE
jgi:amino acid transporter